jgi:HEPN domain-containing protein/predicted nucleotidyltransferase
MSDSAQSSSRARNNRYLVWLEQADFDLRAAQLSADNGFYEWSSFQAGQSLEKALKAVIVHAGMRAPKIHKLGILMGVCNHANNAFTNIHIEFRKIESYTFVARYPFLLPGELKSPHEFITVENAAQSIKLASDSYHAIVQFLRTQKAKPFSGEMPIEYFTTEEVDARITQFVEKIKEMLPIQKVVLFGSFSRNKQQAKSKTMDMLIVTQTELPFFERINQVREYTRGSFPIIEPLVYTPEELEQLLHDEAEGFLENAIEEGVVVFPNN